MLYLKVFFKPHFLQKGQCDIISFSPIYLISRKKRIISSFHEWFERPLNIWKTGAGSRCAVKAILCCECYTVSHPLAACYTASTSPHFCQMAPSISCSTLQALIPRLDQPRTMLWICMVHPGTLSAACAEGSDKKRLTEVEAWVGPEQWLTIASRVGGTSALSLASSPSFL